MHAQVFMVVVLAGSRPAVPSAFARLPRPNFLFTQLAHRYSLAGTAKAVVVLALSGCRGFVWDFPSPPKRTPSEQQDAVAKMW